MLTLQMTGVKRPSLWREGTAYAILRDDTKIGRIDISGRPKRDGEAQIEIREQVYEGRIQITGKAQWTYVPSRWVMQSEGRDLHVAIWESGKTWVTEAEQGIEALRLRRSALSGVMSIEREANQAALGELKWLRARLLPKAVPQGVALATGLDLPETFEVFLLWLVVQDNYRNTDG
jgi:hypothetical protein